MLHARAERQHLRALVGMQPGDDGLGLLLGLVEPVAVRAC